MTEYGQDLEKIGRGIFPYYLAVLFIAPIPFGANRPWAWGLLAVFSLFLLGVYLWNYARQNVRPPEITRDIKFTIIILLSWLLYQIFQLIPLPIDLLMLISPETLELKQASLGGGLGTYIPLSFDISAGFRSLYKSALYVCLFILTICLVQSRDRLRLLILTFVFIGVIQAVWALSIVFFQEKLVFFGGDVGLNVAQGTFSNRNHFGGFLNFSIAAVIALLLSSGFREKRKIHRDKLAHHWQSRMLDWRIYLIPYLGLLVIALIFSESRGALFSCGFMILIMMVSLIYMKVSVIDIFKKFQLIILLVVFVIIFSGVDMIIQRFTIVGEDLSLRMSHWQNGLMIFQDFNFFGAGSGSFQYVYPLYDTGTDKLRLLHAHNDYIELLAEQGLIGFGLIAAAIILCILNAIKAIRKFQSIRQAAFAIASLLAITGFLMHSTVEFNFQIPSNAIYFFVFLAIALLQGMESIHVEKRETVWDEEAFMQEEA